MNALNRNIILATAALVAGLGAREGAHIVQTKAGPMFADYLDPVGIPTACYGHTATARIGRLRDKVECDALLAKDLETAGRHVLRLVKVPLTQAQYNALADFVYNVGWPSFANSTLLRRLNAGDYEGAANEFARWKYAQGVDCSIKVRVCGGIIVRRQWEYKEFTREPIRN